ncbi:hypothetical protein [Brevundimonas diminuta]|uniref:hypothetical protein n=1 Tax=Brevundimonas diminuta TaxID=293 RepID=UPI003D031F1C
MPSFNRTALPVLAALGVAIGAALAVLPAQAATGKAATGQAGRSPAGRSLIDIRDVDRDSVPAGTPAAFGVAFPGAARNEAARQIGDDLYTFVPLTFIPLSDTRVALVSTGANDCTGQACSGMNAVHYLGHDAGEPRYPYSLQGEWLDVGAAGVVGNPALRWGWTTAMGEHPVLYTEAGGVWQGRACGQAVLTELTPEGPVEIASLQIYFSDADAEDGDTGVEGVISAAEKGRSFTVSYSGSSDFTETYRRGPDGRYRLDGKSRVPAC